MAIHANVTVIPRTLAANGQSCRVPQCKIVPRTSHPPRTGAALASMAGSEV
jgi:hypothetical protein